MRSDAISHVFFRTTKGEGGNQTLAAGCEGNDGSVFSRRTPGVLSKYDTDVPRLPVRSGAGRLFAEGHLGS